MSMYGANVGELRSLAAQFDRAADQLDANRMAVGNAIQISAWIGPFATRFRLQWDSEHSARIHSAAQLLHAGARALRANADDQERVSAVDGGGATNRGSSPHSPLPSGSGGVGHAIAEVVEQMRFPGPDGKQNYSTSAAADIALSEVGTSRPVGWNAEGECVKSVQRWINSAGGRFIGGGVVSGYENSGAIPVGNDQVRPGDVIQYTSTTTPDQWVYGVHTVMVVGVNPDGTLHIVQSNSPAGSGRVSEVKNWTPAPPSGLEARVWRFAEKPSAP